MGVENTLLPIDYLPAVAFTVLAQLYGPKAKETEMGAALFTKMAREGTCTFFQLPGTIQS